MNSLVNALYESGCSQETDFRQLNITLFESIDAVHEVEALVTASATTKRFAISRQCSNAIFSLDRASASGRSHE